MVISGMNTVLFRQSQKVNYFTNRCRRYVTSCVVGCYRVFKMCMISLRGAVCASRVRLVILPSRQQFGAGNLF